MYPKKEKLVKEFLYDFSVQAGATGDIALNGCDPNGDLLPEGFIIEKVSVKTDTAFASTGSPTLTVGNSSDRDGFMADIYAAASAANSVVNGGSVAGALIFDDTNDHLIDYRVSSNANSQDVSISIGTAPVTAGKLRVIIEGIIPGSADGY